MKKKKGDVYWKLSMYLIKKHTDQKLEDISDIHKMYYTAVSQSCKRLGEELREDKKLRRIIEEIEKVILL